MHADLRKGGFGNFGCSTPLVDTRRQLEMSDLITICVPTCRRPDLLKEAIESCFRQKYRPLEILVGDDSGDDRSVGTLQGFTPPDGVRVDHVIHNPPLHQARNVDWLIKNSRGTRLLLLHDDDLLCDRGLDRLVEAWEAQSGIVCAYGKQYVLSPAGEVLSSETEDFNRRYGRVKANRGVQESPLSAGLSQQIPNNCFLVDAKVARGVGYRPEEAVGNSVDEDFGIRLGQASGDKSFYYIDEFVSCYRLTENSILRARHFNYGEHLLFSEVARLDVPERDLAARDLSLKRMSAKAVLNAAMAGQRLKALSIFFSRHYELRYTDIRSLFRLIYIASPSLGARLNGLLSSTR
jgi:glycosyltransferase involved in cell wall biosynthesis